VRLRDDLRAYTALAKEGGLATLFDLSLLYLVLFRLGSGLYQMNTLVFAPIRIFEKILEIVFGVYIPFGTRIGGGLVIYHYHGIIINGKTEIGKNCSLYARVCIGNRFAGDGTPKIGDNVVIGTGACIFGPIVIPPGSSIPANAVVTPRTLSQYVRSDDR
jgi:serine O-acetyltransferase